MPLFEYAPVCHTDTEATQPCCHFELLQASTEAPLTHCPTCGHTVTRIFSAFGIGTAGARPATKSCGTGSPCSSSSTTAAGRVAQMTTSGHVCCAGCKH